MMCRAWQCGRYQKCPLLVGGLCLAARWHGRPGFGVVTSYRVYLHHRDESHFRGCVSEGVGVGE